MICHTFCIIITLFAFFCENRNYWNKALAVHPTFIFSRKYKHYSVNIGYFLTRENVQIFSKRPVCGHQRWDRVPSRNSEFKCQHSQFTYSLLMKRNLPIFERVPLSQAGFEPRTSHIKGVHLTTWSTNLPWICVVHSVLQIVDAAIPSGLQRAHQGYNSIG